MRKSKRPRARISRRESALTWAALALPLVAIMVREIGWWPMATWLVVLVALAVTALVLVRDVVWRVRSRRSSSS